MAGKVFLNGLLVNSQEAVISVFDHGFLYGDGIFDTMRSYGGRVFCLEKHLDRLFANGKALGLALPWSRGYLAEAIQETLEANGLQDAYIRITVSRGEGPIGIDPRTCPHPTLVIMAKELKINPQTYRDGIEIMSLSTRRNSIESTDPRIKSLNFLNNILAKLELIKSSYHDGIMLNYEHWVAETTVSNIFFSKKGILRTPAIEVGILPGITRQAMLELAEELDIPYEEGYYSLEQLMAAEEIFLTNSISEVIPVVKVNNQAIGTGQCGSMTKQLLEGYRGKVQSQNSQTKILK